MKVEIPKCSSPERYEQYALNVEAKEPEKAQEARRQAVRMRAELKGARTAAEMECLQAVFAYEWTLFKKHGKRQRAFPTEAGRFLRYIRACVRLRSARCSRAITDTRSRDVNDPWAAG
jgi:hypothetical protein